MKSIFAPVWASSLLLGALTFTAPAQEAGEGEALKKLEEAQDHFYEAKDVIKIRYRKELAEAIAKGDKVEVYLLDFDAIEQTPSDHLYWETRLEEGEFPIMPYGSKTKVLKKVELTPEQRKEFLPALQKTVSSEEDHGGAMCHHPIHGVRVFSGGKIIFQSSFCWHCNNYYLHYPDGPQWLGIGNRKDLATAFEKMMPVPQKEIDRFNEKYGPKMKEKE